MSTTSSTVNFIRKNGVNHQSKNYQSKTELRQIKQFPVKIEKNYYDLISVQWVSQENIIDLKSSKVNIFMNNKFNNMNILYFYKIIVNMPVI